MDCASNTLRTKLPPESKNRLPPIHMRDFLELEEGEIFELNICDVPRLIKGEVGNVWAILPMYNVCKL